MLFAIFILFICLEVTLALKFLRTARLVVDRSNEVGVGLFGRTYQSAYQLYMDFNFVNNLFDGNGIDSIDDLKLSSNLSQMRKMLFGQVIGAFALFLLGISLGLME